MNQKEIDSEVLRIIIDVLKKQTKDDESDTRWREDAQWYLNMIGQTFIDVTSWEYDNDGYDDDSVEGRVEYKNKIYEFGTSNLSSKDIKDE